MYCLSDPEKEEKREYTKVQYSVVDMVQLEECISEINREMLKVGQESKELSFSATNKVPNKYQMKVKQISNKISESVHQEGPNLFFSFPLQLLKSDTTLYKNGTKRFSALQTHKSVQATNLMFYIVISMGRSGQI